ncbi:MAG: hypothetical protein MUO43_03510 [Desulfobacterales bacterium]|nr:hypothetical protein [Desulfobacterales bacterium]
MKKKNVNLVVLLLIAAVVSLGLTGCKDADKEKALAETAAAKTELKKVKADLASIMTERDSLKLELATVIEARDRLQALVGQAPNIKGQLAELTQERDTAIAKATGAQTMVEKLKSQLAVQIEKITGLEGQNKKLQEMIDELKKNLGGEMEMPSIPKL